MCYKQERNLKNKKISKRCAIRFNPDCGPHRLAIHLFYQARFHSKALTRVHKTFVKGVIVLADTQVRKMLTLILITKFITMFMGRLIPAL